MSAPSKSILDNSWINSSRLCSSLCWNNSNITNKNFHNIQSRSWFTVKKLTLDNSKVVRDNHEDLSKYLKGVSPHEVIKKPRKSTGFSKAKSKNITKPKKQAPNRVRKIRVYTTTANRMVLNKWFGCARKTYNWALGSIKDKLFKANMRYMTNFMWLRNRFVNANNVPKDLKYLLDCPKDIRANALKDLANALSINFEKRKDKPEFKFSMKFRTKKEIQSIKFDDYAAYIHDWTVSKNSEKQKGKRVQFTMFRTKLKDPLWFYVRNRDIKNNKVLEKPIRECTLVRDKLGRFYLHVPIYLEHKKEEHLDQEWCAIDPGVRSLMTIYSPNKEKCFKLANSDIGRIYRLCLSVDKLVSKGAKSKGKVKRAIKKHELKLRKKIKNLADEVHWKIINFLTSNFTHIIYPTYNTGNMIKKSERSIGNKSVRQMISWRNFTLKQRLIERCKEKGVQLIQCTEEYTSKTCTNCGHIDKNLKDKKIYSCKQCNLVIDRDLNAARNIFIKNVYSKIQSQVVSKEI